MKDENTGQDRRTVRGLRKPVDEIEWLWGIVEVENMLWCWPAKGLAGLLFLGRLTLMAGEPYRELIMKLWTLMIVVGCCVSVGASFALAQGEKVDVSKLPPKVAEAVKGRFPGATITQVTKELENGVVVYDVEMTRAGKKHEMDCKEDGTLIDLQNEVPASELPAGAAEAIKKKHPGSTIKEVGEILVAKDGKEIKDHFEVIIETAEKKEMELTIKLDGTIEE
jgi:hypothetical protein